MSDLLKHVHLTRLAVAVEEETPPHEPRESTPEYLAAHRRLIDELDTPCYICGVRKSTGGQMESHHWPLERSLALACDPAKVGARFPEVTDRASLMRFVDSERNLIVLCAVHHRDPIHGIHHALAQDWCIQPFLLDGYRIVARPEEADAVRAANEAILRAAGVASETEELPK